MNVVFLFGLLLVVTTNAFNIMCYYRNLSPYMRDKGMFHPEDIDPQMCTHIYYVCGNPEKLDILFSDEYDEIMYNRISDLKNKNSRLKIILVVGCNTGSFAFQHLVTTVRTIDVFVRNAVKFLRKRNFDGLEINWRYPRFQGGSDNDRPMFALLLQKLMTQFISDSITRRKPRLSLSVSLPSKKEIIDYSYDISKLTNHVDYMNILTFDYHCGWDSTVGFNAPLYAYIHEKGYARNLNVNWTVNYYLSLGAIKSKMNIGIASYGRTFTLANATVHNVLSPAIGKGRLSETTATSGFLAYYEICDVINTGGKVIPVTSQGNSYVIKDDQWIGFDDANSITKKVCYAITNRLGGVTFSYLDYDDFGDYSCHEGKYPLLSAIYRLQSHPETICSSIPEAVVELPPPIDTQMLNESEFRIVCYIMSSSQTRPGKGMFSPHNINPSLCTHLTYAFGKPTALTIDVEPSKESTFQLLMNIKNRYPHIKTLLAIGGDAIGSKPFIQLIQSEYSRNSFAINSVIFLRDRHFDGLDVVWMYPRSHRKGYQLLMKEIRRVFEKDAADQNLPRLLLVASIASNKDTIDESYDVSELDECTDFLNVMSYDYHGPREHIIRFPSPLESTPMDINKDKYLNVDWTMQRYVNLGASLKKLNVGIPSYGISFHLTSYDKNTPWSLANGSGPAAPFTSASGFMSYYEVCDFIESGATKVKILPHDIPYAFKNTTWVGYEDAQTVSDKACYAKVNGFGGVMLFSLDSDDFLGTTCREGKYPLTSAIYKVATSQIACERKRRSTFSGAHRNAKMCYTVLSMYLEYIFIYSLLTATM